MKLSEGRLMNENEKVLKVICESEKSERKGSERDRRCRGVWIWVSVLSWFPSMATSSPFSAFSLFHKRKEDGPNFAIQCPRFSAELCHKSLLGAKTFDMQIQCWIEVEPARGNKFIWGEICKHTVNIGVLLLCVFSNCTDTHSREKSNTCIYNVDVELVDQQIHLSRDLKHPKWSKVNLTQIQCWIDVVLVVKKFHLSRDLKHTKWSKVNLMQIQCWIDVVLVEQQIHLSRDLKHTKWSKVNPMQIRCWIDVVLVEQQISQIGCWRPRSLRLSRSPSVSPESRHREIQTIFGQFLTIFCLPSETRHQKI